MRARWLLGLLFALPPGAAVADESRGRETLPSSLERWRAGLELLATSQPRAALEAFLELHEREPDDPCGSYFPAQVYLD
jgi:hypothetical protein